MRVGTGAAVAVVMAEAMKSMTWDLPVIEPDTTQSRQGRKPTGVAKAKRAAQKRRNVRARAGK